jgi:hypothetical protein
VFVVHLVKERGVKAYRCGERSKPRLADVLAAVFPTVLHCRLFNATVLIRFCLDILGAMQRNWKKEQAAANGNPTRLARLNSSYPLTHH